MILLLITQLVNLAYNIYRHKIYNNICKLQTNNTIDQINIYIDNAMQCNATSITDRAVPSIRAARAYSSSWSSLELNKARALFLSSSTPYFLQTPNSDKTGKPLAQTFGTQLRDKFSLACQPVTIQINSGTVPAISSGTRVTTITN